MSIYARLMCFAGCLSAALLFVFLQPPGPFLDIHATAVASLALLLCLPMVDSALFGRTVDPSLGGALLGLSMGFFMRQASIAPSLAPGAERILLGAFVLSVGVGLFRRLRRRR